MQSVLVHGSHAYMPGALLESEYPLYFSEKAIDVYESKDALIILGGWAPELGGMLAHRHKEKRLVYCVVDAANTLHTINLMQSGGILQRWLTALIRQDRIEIARCFYELLKPDVFVVNNPRMEQEFKEACPESKVVTLHPPRNVDLGLNDFDRFADADSRLRYVQNGGLNKYIEPNLQSQLASLELEGVIKLVHPNIEGGYLEENTLVPPSPQIVISCRKSRAIKINDDLEIDVTDIERDWKPATKYVNAISSGSHYIGTLEESVKYLSSGDPLSHLVSSAEEALKALNRVLPIPCHHRRQLAFDRKRLRQSSDLSRDRFAEELYYLAVGQSVG